MSRPVSPYFLLCLTSLFWSLNFIIGKMLVTVIPPVTISFLRWLLPCLFFMIFYRRDLQAHFSNFTSRVPLILLLGATGYSLNSIMVFEAVNYTTTINTSFINSFNPVLIALAGFLMYRYHVSRLQGLGFLISLSGVLFIVFKGEIRNFIALQVNIGDLFMVASISLWSIHTILYKKKAHLFSGRGIFPLMMLGGLIVTFPFSLAECIYDDWSWIGNIRFRHVLAILVLNIFPSVLASLFWNHALTKISANRVAIFQYLIPVYTTLISFFFLGERLQSFHLFGGALIFFGVMLVATINVRR
ncbi:DMT family transporter [Desulfosediminicola flagellatus]|uniref:DMT family transporter n=1 Tax=Desulfosediminicola flagellatus TaxID=2569541 RepID=UPI0010AB783C|nr:DMT family transporter [Desulfosediminicola flagellatus]